ncbi:MAG: DUF480 domain-containing protein [Planctomycetota bacterium]
MLDPTQQRIIGVLIEKELSVPDSYPLTENALLAGCNQKSNRDPEMSLESFELSGAIMAMQLSGWIAKVSGSRVDRYRHQVASKLGVDEREKAILAELLVRGPQAPGALKARVARMGLDGSVDEVSAVLDVLASRPRPLVEQLPKQPRERDQRWAHCLGAAAEAESASPAADVDPDWIPEPKPVVPSPAAPSPAVPAAPAAPAATAAAPAVADARHVAELEERVARLESELGQLAEEVGLLRERLAGGGGSAEHGL